MIGRSATFVSFRTAEVLQDSIQEILEDVHLQPSDIIEMVTDNAEVMLKLCRLLDFSRSPCLAHLIQLIVAAVFGKKKGRQDEEALPQGEPTEEDENALVQGEPTEEEKVDHAETGDTHFADGCAALAAASKVVTVIRSSSLLSYTYMASFMGTEKVC